MQPMPPTMSLPQPVPPCDTGNPALREAAQKRAERRRAANLAGGAPLIFFGGNLLLSFVLFFVALFSGGMASFYSFYELVNDFTFSLLLNSFFQAIFMTLPFYLMLRLSGVRAAGTLGYGRPKKGTALPAVFIGMGGMMVADAVNNAFAGVLRQIGIVPTGGISIDSLGSVSETITIIIAVSVIPALFEEFAYRGVIFSLLREKLGVPTAIFTSALLFGAMHGNFEQMPFAFLVGLILGWVRVYTDSMWCCMLLHLLNNTLSSILSDLLATFPGAPGYSLVNGIMLVLLLIGLVAVLLSARRDPTLFSLPKTDEEPTLREGMSIVLSAPCVLLALIAFALEAVLIQIGGLL